MYTSSAAVFAPPEFYLSSPSGRGAEGEGPLADDVLLTPSTHYGVFKCCNEGNARIYFQDFGISSIGLRPWTVYGVGRDFGMTSEPTKAIKSLALNRAYHITYGGWQDMQYVDDVAKITVHCLDAPYQGAKSYNLRGHVVDMPALHRTLVEVEPAAAKSITFGDRQIAIAYDLDERRYSSDLWADTVDTPLPGGHSPHARDVSQAAARGGWTRRIWSDPFTFSARMAPRGG